MKRMLSLLAAGAMIAAPTPAAAAPPSGSTPNGPHFPSPTTAPGYGQVNGQGYNHMHTQAQAKGQPNQSCEALGTTPGNSAGAPGGGSHYAGSQAQNSRNSASVSQYDVACANQPH